MTMNSIQLMLRKTIIRFFTIDLPKNDPDFYRLEYSSQMTKRKHKFQIRCNFVKDDLTVGISIFYQVL